MAHAAAQPPRRPIPEALLEQIRSGQHNLWSPQQILKWAVDHFAPRLALSASFGSREGLVILDMLHKIAPGQTRVFTIDTGRLYQETYKCMDQVREKYGVTIETYFPDPERVKAMVQEHGFNLFYRSVDLRKLCCGIRKVEPLERALRDLDAWIAGLRPEQSVTRKNVKAVEIDQLHGGLVKLNPLVSWSQEEVAAYVKEHDVPVNLLHVRNFPSVGCLPCSRAVDPGEDERSGRWWWEQPESRECGLHVALEEKGSGI